METAPIDSSTSPQELIWEAPRTFFGAPTASDLSAIDAEVAFLGVPFDGGTPQPGNRTGQTMGPAAARRSSWDQFEASGGAAGCSAGWYDIEADKDFLVGIAMADLGDVAIQGADIERNFARMTEVARRVSGQGALLVAVGGDHSFSYPMCRGMEPAGEVDVVHVDAHADFLDQATGARFSGTSQLRRISELPFVSTVTPLGLRNVLREEVDGLRDAGARWATSTDLIEAGAAEVVADLVPESDALYVSVDLDVLDIAWVPGTTLPEPGGLSYRQLREVLVEVARRGRVVGFDIAELNPPYDPSGNTARIATWLITHFLSEIFDQRQ